MILSLTLCASLLLPLLPIGARATENAEVASSAQPIAELTLSPNRTKGIVSMTFDDGSIPTAEWLNEKFKQYDLYGSTMLITSKNISTQENVDTWKRIYADGRLEPQSHSYTHMVLPTELWANANSQPETLENNTEENYKRELYQSGVMIEEAFGKFPLCFAPSNNTMSDGGMKHVKKYYYAMRQGSRYNPGEIQSLDPTPGSHDRGGWYNLLMSGTKNSESRILEGLNTAARSGGWLVVMCHGIGADSGDSTYDKFEPVLQQMSTLQQSGLVWVTTFGNATKYIRQRQNSRVNVARTSDTTYRVTLSMDNYTADGLPLPKSEFNLPLTVRFRLPDGATHMMYDIGEGEVLLEGYEEEDGRFAYLNMQAGKTVANVRFCNENGQNILKEDIFTAKHGVVVTDKFTYTLYLKNDIELLQAKIADGEWIPSAQIERKTLKGEEFYAFSYTAPLSEAPLPFSISVVAKADGKEGVKIFRCSLLDYLGALLDDTQTEDMQMFSLNAMILMRDIVNEKKLVVNTSPVQDAIMKYHYMPKAPDVFKTASKADTSSIHASVAFDFTQGCAFSLTPSDGKEAECYTFFDAEGKKLVSQTMDEKIYVAIPLSRVTEKITIVYTDGSYQQTLLYSLSDDYARVKNTGLLSSLYISLYHTSLASHQIK